MKENEVLYPRMQENDKKQLPEINVYGTKVYIKYKGKNKVVPVSDAFLLLKLINIKGLGTSVMFNGKIIEPNQDINLKQTYEEKTKQEQSLPPFKVDDFINKVYSVIGVKAILPKESFYAMKQKRESKRKEEELKTSEHQNKKTKIVLEEESHEMYYNLMHESVKKSPKKENEFVLQNFNKNLSSFFLEFRILFNGIEFVLVKFTDERGVVLKHGSYKDVYFTLNSLQYSYGKIESIKFKTILYENPENFTPYTFPNLEVRKKERLCRKFNDIFMQSLNNKFFYITQTNYLSDKMFVNEENKPTIYKSIDPVKNVSKQKTPISRQEGVPTRSNTLPLSQLNFSNQEMYNKTPKFTQSHVKIQQTEENLTKMTDTKQIFREESKKEIYKNSFKHKLTNEPQKNESFYNKAPEFGKNELIRRTSEFYPMRSQSYYKVREQNILPRQSPYPVRNPTFHSRNISNYSGYPNQANRNYVVNPRVQLNPLNRAPSNNYNVSEQYIMNNNMNNIYSTINPIVNPTINHSSNYNPTNNFNVNSNYNPVNTFNQNNSYNPNIYSNMNPITLNPNMNQNINSNFNPNINANMNVMPNVTNNSLTSNINNHYYNKNMTYHNTPNPNMNINGMNPSANNLVNNNNMMPGNNIMGNNNLVNNTVMNNESYNSSYPNLYNQSMGYFNNYNQPKTPYINMNYDYQMNQPINNTQFHPPNYQPMNNFNPYMNYQINNYSVKRRSTPNLKNNEQINYYNNLQGYQEKEPLFVRNDQYVDFNEEHRKIFNQQRNINDNYLNEMQIRNEQQFRNLNDNKVFYANESQMRNVNERQMRNINERQFKNEVKIINEDNFIPLTSPSNYKPGKISDFPIQEHKIINEESKKNKTPKNFYDPKNDYVSTNKIFNEQSDNVNELKFNEEMSKPITYPIGSSYPTENTKSKTQRQETNTFSGKIYYNEEEKFYKEKIKKEEKNYKKINSTEFKRKDYSEDKKTKRREIKVEEKLEEIITLEEIKRENELKKLSQQKNDALKSEEDNFDPMPDIF